jgi:hypothetical protein
MTNQLRRVGSLDETQVHLVLRAAIAAPSLHNSQPWRFHRTGEAIELYADRERALPAADPDHRELLLACGAALLNLRLAIRSLGIYADTRLCPDPRRPDLLATVRPAGARPTTPFEQRLYQAIPRRHTNRRPFSDEPVREPVRHALRRAAQHERAWLVILSPAQLPQVRELAREAHETQLADPHFRGEWARWTARDTHLPDGVPATSAGPLPEPHDHWVLRDFSAGQARARVPGKDFEDHPLIAVVGSFHDQRLAHLQAGQAMQRVLLTATDAGLSASFVSQLVEVPSARGQLRQIIGGGLWPQTVLRIGAGFPVPATNRRDIHDVTEITAIPEDPRLGACSVPGRG